MTNRRSRTLIYFVTLAALIFAASATAAPLVPSAPVTRVELAEILSAGLDLADSDSAAQFTDLASCSDQARSAVAKVHEAGLMNGFPGNQFRPKDKITRAQALTVLLTASDRIPSSPAAKATISPGRAPITAPFTDVSANHWAAGYIARAWQKGLVSGSPDGRFLPGNSVTVWELAQFVQRFLGSDAADQAGLIELVHTDPPVLPEHSAATVPVLLYHHLAPAGSGFDTNRATITPEEFQWQMDYLADNGYKVLSPNELASFLAGDLRVPKKSVAITFDDGYASNLKYAYPALKEHRFPAIFHVITGTVPDQPQQPYDTARLQSLSWPELKELTASGLITIASHTHNLHIYLPSGVLKIQRPALVARIIDPATGKLETDAAHYQRILADLKTSASQLTSQLQKPVTILAYPYGVSDSVACRAADEAGFTLTFSTQATAARFGSGTGNVPRLVVEPGISQDQFQRLLQK